MAGLRPCPGRVALWRHHPAAAAGLTRELTGDERRLLSTTAEAAELAALGSGGAGSLRRRAAQAAAHCGRRIPPDRPGAAYLGLALDAEWSAGVMGERTGPVLYGAVGMASELAVERMRNRVPAERLVDVGRPVPAS
ncbi:hypothetical protein [Streptomyces sp. Tu102]|uniref:hypothetical protein n=1 Tax=Streptomyces TaxID=1883 RepID=UPI001BDD4F21|nr:hypothetical protein [Streptomyces sp. Tu102]MBT1094211.1 hypothetical protein [Streptomyces sp. Tu102]